MEVRIMTHITQEQAVELAKTYGYWSGETIEMNDTGIAQFANIVITQYLDSLAEGLPEPACYWEPDGTIEWLGKDGAGFSTNTGPAHGWKITHYYTRDQLLACIAKEQAANTELFSLISLMRKIIAALALTMDDDAEYAALYDEAVAAVAKAKGRK